MSFGEITILDGCGIDPYELIGLGELLSNKTSDSPRATGNENAVSFWPRGPIQTAGRYFDGKVQSLSPLGRQQLFYETRPKNCAESTSGLRITRRFRTESFGLRRGQAHQALDGHQEVTLSLKKQCALFRCAGLFRLPHHDR